ncbi:MAG: hypothetical protein M8863_12345 [marine benthic group bacterium]|nr:hypothetical protein [Gemmatimonadota bacterium]
MGRSVRIRAFIAACVAIEAFALVHPGPSASQVLPEDSALSRPAVEALVDLAIRAYGGEEALAAAGQVVQRGSVTSTMRGGIGGRLVRVYERPIRLRVEIDYPGAETEVRILDGGRGWRNGGEASGPMYRSMLLQAARLGMPAVLSEFRASLEDRGTVAREGRERRMLALSFHRGLEVIAEIDPETGHVLRSEGTISSPDGEVTLRFATEYSDFREVEGILVPFHEVNWAQGRRTGETQLESVKFETDLPPGTFHPPIEKADEAEVRRTRI